VAVTNAEATREHYASALDGVWTDLSAALGRLERMAADPDELDEDTLETLPVLQYSLHRAGESVLGIAPPPQTSRAHRELAVALEDARDITGDVAASLEADEPDAATELVHEWRAALFRVRLARRRVARVEPRPVLPPDEPRIERRAAASLAAVVIGTALFTTGAVLAVWAIWAAGLALVAAASFIYRP
jgi:hypothetical protein